MRKELKLDLFNIYDVVVFEDETGIVQDCVCSILKDSVEPEIAGVVQCNIYSISIYNDGYKVWERDGKDLPYYTTNKKIIHLYTLKNDNRFYEIYPTNDYESYMSFDKAGPREALECLEALQSIRDKYSMPLTEYVNSFDYIKTIKQVLLKQQEQEKENQELLQAVAWFKQRLEDTDNIKVATTMMKQLDTNIKLEKELERYRIIERAIKDGIWVIDLPSDKLKFQRVKLSNIETEWYLSNDLMCVNVKDYKYLFWLKEDKSDSI